MKFISLLLYNLALSLYSGMALLISPFNPKAKKWIDGRKKVWDELERKVPARNGSTPLTMTTQNRIWFHCSSLGEYEQALPLIERLKSNSEIVITFFSPSGYEIVKKKNPDALIFYLPVDTAANAKRFINIVQPQLAVFVRYDLWYYYLNELQNRNIKSILISAVFREEHIFFKPYGSLFHTMLKSFSHIFVQDEHSKKVLLTRGFQNVTKAGDTRIDRVTAILNEGKQFPLIEKFTGDKKLLIIGSLEPKDESVVLPLINHPEISKQLKFIIAPHHVEKNYLEKIQSALQGKSILYSTASAETIAQSNILIIDSIGILSRLYAYADIAYVGGGFGEGLHNVLEPAVWGVPILFGPKHQKFLEAVELVKRGGAYIVNNADDLNTKTARLLSDSIFLIESAQATSEFIQENKGATEQILNKLK